MTDKIKSIFNKRRLAIKAFRVKKCYKEIADYFEKEMKREMAHRVWTPERKFVSSPFDGGVYIPIEKMQSFV